jgi:hypothetical protein
VSQYFEGNAKVSALAPPNTAPTSSEAGAGNVDVGDHEVAVTFVHSSGGETLCGAEVLVTVATSAKEITLDDIPLGPADCTRRRIYASKVGDPTGPKFLVGTITDNTTTDGFSYNVADTGLGQQEPVTNRYPTANVELTNGGITGAWAGRHVFKFQGEAVFFPIAAVVDDTHFTLSGAYTGLKALGSPFPYLVAVDFTTELGLPELSPGDVDIRDIYTRAVRQLDSYLAGHRIFAGYTEYIQTLSADRRGLSIRAATGQTANVFEVLDEDGAVVFAVEADGTTTQTIGTAVFDQVKTQTLLGGVAQRNIAKLTNSGGNDFLDVGDTAGWFATRIFAGIGGAAIYAGSTGGNHVVGIGLGSSPTPSGLDVLYVKNSTAGVLSSGRAMTIETDEAATSALAVLRISRLTNTVGRSAGIQWVLQDDAGSPARVEVAYSAARLRTATAGSVAGDYLIGLTDASTTRRIRASVTNAGLGLGFGTGVQAPTDPTHAVHIKGAAGATCEIKFEETGGSGFAAIGVPAAGRLALLDHGLTERVSFVTAAGGTQGFLGAGITAPLAALHAHSTGVNAAIISSAEAATSIVDPLRVDRNDNTAGRYVGVAFRMNNSTPAIKELAFIGARLRTATALSEDGDLVFAVTNAGSRTEAARITAPGRFLVNTATDDAAGTAAAMTIKAVSAAAHGLRVVQFTAQTPLVELGSSGSDVGVVSVFDASAVEQSRLSGGGASWVLGRLGIGPSSGNLTPKTFSSSSFYVGSTAVAADFEADSTSGTTFGVLNVTRLDNTAGHQAGISLRLADSGGLTAKQEYAYIAARIRTNTAGAEDGDIVLSTITAATRTERARIMGSNGYLALGTSGDASATVHVLKSQNADSFVRIDNAYNAASPSARAGFEAQMWDGASTNPAFQAIRTADGAFTLTNKAIKAGATDSIGLTIQQDGNYPIRLSTNGAQGQALEIRTLTELVTIAAAATSDSTIQIPANAIVLAVSAYTQVAIPTATTYDVGTSGTPNQFVDDLSTTLGTSSPGTKAGPLYFAAVTNIRITPSTTPGAATGRVRIAIHYYLCIPATS